MLKYGSKPPLGIFLQHWNRTGKIGMQAVEAYREKSFLFYDVHPMRPLVDAGQNNNTVTTTDPGDHLNTITVSAGLQGGAKFGLKGVLGAEVGINVGRWEVILGQGDGFRSSYALSLSIGDYSIGLNAEKFGANRDQFQNVSEWKVSPFVSAGNASMNGDFVLQLGGAVVLGFNANINLSQIGREIGGLFSGD